MAHKLPSKSQKKRLSKFLSQGERIVLVTTIGQRYFLLMLFLLLFLPLLIFYGSVAVFVGFIQIPAYSWVKFLSVPSLILLIYNTSKYSHLIRMRQSYTYALTNRRFLIIRGIFARKIVTAPLTAITHVTVEQSFWQRFLFNTGHLVIITAGFDQREIVIEHVGDPVEFKVMIEELTERIEETWGEGDSESGGIKLRSLST